MNTYNSYPSFTIPQKLVGLRREIMRLKTGKLVVLGLAVICMAIFGLASGKTTVKRQAHTGKADTDVLIAAYKKWKDVNVLTGDDRYLTINVGGINGLSVEKTYAKGSIKIGLSDGLVKAKIEDLADGDWELWLIENRPSPDHSTLPEVGDETMSIGHFNSANGVAELTTTIGLETLSKIKVDRVAITRAGENPSNFVLTGSPNLFQRLSLRQVELANEHEETSQSFLPAFLENLGPISVQADSSTALSQLVEQGRTIFVTQQFNGNGRTCATCHPESNNFTLDPAFIATLPSNNPLFVAEFNPALANNFEKPQLMRQFGLILENVDGFEDLQNKFVMRGSQSTLALTNTITAPNPVFAADFTTNGANPNPAQRLGWSGDGAPGSGSLREFAIGAVIQHFTKRLNRVPGTDFRLPTDQELDAMEAFQLSLGRTEELNIKTLQVKDAQANTGKALYLDTGTIGEPGHKNCNACHINGGGNSGFSLNPASPGFSPVLDANPVNANVSEATMTILIPKVFQNNLPPDGGFGRIPLPGPPNGPGGFGNFAEIPGLGTVPIVEFNSLSLIEAADTAPFFHNHMATTLEEAIAFYGTPAFQALGSIGGPGGPIPVSISGDPNNSEVKAISTFLRVLNTVENIRSSVALGKRAIESTGTTRRDLVKLALEDTDDALKVLTTGSLAGSSTSVSIITARARLTLAKTLLITATEVADPVINAIVIAAINEQRKAREALVDPNTLPVSYKN
jgi:cytochrome c peroxidase